MEIKNYNAYYFFLILIGISVLAFFIVQPFIIAILLASILAVIFQGPYKFFLKITGGRSHVSAFFTALLGSFLIIAVFALLFSLIANEAGTLYREASAGAGWYQNLLNSILRNNAGNPTLQGLGLNATSANDLVGKLVSQSTGWVIAFVQAVYQGIAGVVFLLFVMFFSLYYFLIDGKNLVRRIMYMSPLKDAHETMLIGKFISISRATMKGALVIGIIQGLIGGVTFAIAGVPSAAILGVFMVFFSLVPIVGTGIVWLPAGIIMLLLGNIWQGILILAVGMGIISTIDNFLRPKLVGKDTQMHPLIVLFATLGGLKFFGFFGFIIGPIVVALFLTLWEIYAIEFKGQLKKYNA